MPVVLWVAATAFHAVDDVLGVQVKTDEVEPAPGLDVSDSVIEWGISMKMVGPSTQRVGTSIRSDSTRPVGYPVDPQPPLSVTAQSNRRTLLLSIPSLQRSSDGVSIRPSNGGDLKRADDAESQDFDPKKLTDAASLGIGESTGF